MIYRKKGFTISQRGTAERLQYFERLPKEINGEYCRNERQCFSLAMLKEYLRYKKRS